MSAIAPCLRTAVYSGLMSAAGGAGLRHGPGQRLYKYAQTGEHGECFLRPPAATIIITSTVTMMIKAVLLLCTLALLVLATQAAVVR